MPLQIARSARVNYPLETYIGDRGQIFWDEFLGELRLSDGRTPGGLSLESGATSLNPQFIASLPSINPIVQDDDLFLLYDASTASLKKVTFQQLNLSGSIGYTGSQGLGFIDAELNQSGELILVREDSSSVNAGKVIGYTGSAGSSGITDITPNSGLEINNGILSTIYNTSISDSVESVSVGGASTALASEWKNKNLVQVIDAILFPDINPSYTIPTISISGTQVGVKEIGQIINQTITVNGSENDAGSFSAIDIKRGSTVLQSDTSLASTTITAIIDQFGYANPNNPNLRYTSSYTDSFTVISGSTSWSASGTYQSGLPKKNNKGIDDIRTPLVRSTSAPQAGSVLTSTSVSITGIYPYFWGVSSSSPTVTSIAAEIANGTANKVLSSSTGTVTITFNASAQFVWFAHYSGYTAKTRWYNTELNQGPIGSGNFILSPVNQVVDSPEGYWNNVSFSIYISDAATVTEGAIQFRNS